MCIVAVASKAILQKINSATAASPLQNEQSNKQNSPDAGTAVDNSAQLLLELQKRDRDLAYKDEEIRSLKQIAQQVAMSMEPYKEREREYQALITAKDAEIEKKDIEVGRMKEIHLTLNQQIADLQHSINVLTDSKLLQDASIDKRDH